ncbi:hypothetical protein ISS09_02205 [Candidatus Woesearchaeota archaeon]|nr:hypothetical protein [Candidatus Woesearchaeota archaeon]
MELETIILEGVAVFSLGFATGIKDNRQRFGLELTDYLHKKGELNPIFTNVDKNVNINYFDKYVSKFGNKASLLAGLWIYAFNSPFIESYVVPIGLGVVTGLLFKTGTILGKTTNNFYRCKAKLTEKNYLLLDELLDNLKNGIITHGFDYPDSEEGLVYRRKIADLILKKKNIGIYEQIFSKSINVFNYASQYNTIQTFLENTDVPAAISPLSNPFTDKVEALIVHGDKLYSMKIDVQQSDIFKDDEMSVELVAPSVNLEEITWNGSVDALTVMVSNRSNQGLYLVTGNGDLLTKKTGALLTYISLYHSRRDYETELKSGPQA